MSAPRELTRAQLMPMADYAAVRRQKRSEATALKRVRRVSVGPFATFNFESFDTMWIQIHEMLFIEKGGEAQIAGELAAYNPLIPKGRDLVATLMFEIDDPVRRERELGRLGGVEAAICIRVGGHSVTAVPESEVERTDEHGRTSSIHFLHFPFSDEAIVAFRDPSQKAVLMIAHANYGHMAVLPDEARAALAGDFD